MVELFKLHNTSRYSLEAVTTLVEFGLREADFDLSKLLVLVRNNQAAYSGRAYRRVPRSSPFYRLGYNWMITANIGPQSRYPVDNLYTRHKKDYLTGWIDAAQHDATHGKPGWGRREATPWGGRYGYDVSWGIRVAPDGINYQYRFYRSVATKVPYGGVKSPEIHLDNWQEGVVYVIAHEAHHVKQFIAKARCWEHQCETAAAGVLQEYRARIAGFVS